jgi:hypothetical protein
MPKGKTYSKGKSVEEVRLSGIHGVHEVTVPGGHATPDRRRERDFSKSGITVQEPDGGFRDEQDRMRAWGLIP